MSSIKITDLPKSTLPYSGNEDLLIVQNGYTTTNSLCSLTNYLSGDIISVDAIQSVFDSSSYSELFSIRNSLSAVSIQGEGIIEPSTFLRNTRNIGYNSLQTQNHRIWRIAEKMRRERSSLGYNTYDNRFRSVTFGDSVACDMGAPIASFWGTGGGDNNLQGWTSQGAAVPVDSEGGNYPLWTDGVYTLFDEWARAPRGLIRHLDANFTNGTYVERTTGNNPFYEVIVHYLSKNSTGSTGDGSYGSFKIQYKINHGGSWIDLTGAIGSVSTNGGTFTNGVVDTNNSLPNETYSQARFNLPSMDVYSIRIVATSGRVRLCTVIFNAGGLYINPVLRSGVIGGALSVNFAQGGRLLSSHFSQITQDVMNAALGFIDPHIITYKSLNDWGLDTYKEYWNNFATKIMTAAPNALLIVCGSHPRNAKPTNYNPDDIAVDDYLKDWCANTEGTIFIDVRQNFPAFKTGPSGYLSATNSVDDLWADGVHIYSNPSPNWGGGESWVKALVWETIRPACQYALLEPGDENYSYILPYAAPSEIRLYKGTSRNTLGSRDGKLSLTLHPRSDGQLTIRSSNALYNAGTQAFLNKESGIHTTASINTTSPSSLTLLSNSIPALTFGHHPNNPILGFAINIDGSNSANLSRAKDGYRMKVPWPIYGVKPGLIIEGRTDSPPGTTRLFGMDLSATDAAVGSPLWSWFADGTVVYEGMTSDTNQITFTYENPAADATIHTPINAISGTGGTYDRVTAVVPSYATQAVGNLTVGVGEVFYAENVKKIFTRLS